MSICSTLKSVNPKSSGGSAPWTPGQGLCPCTPARGPKAGPWTPPKIGSRLRARYVRSAHMFASTKKSARAYALAMCAPRTCFAQQKNRLALTRSLCALRAHVCPTKIGPPAIQKNRLALRARYVRYAHMFAPP